MTQILITRQKGHPDVKGSVYSRFIKEIKYETHRREPMWLVGLAR